LARTLLQALDFLQFVRAPAKSDNCPGTRIGLKASVTHSTPQGSPHSGLTLGDMKESGGWLPGDGMNRAEPMMVLF
jgi:hypothetical protein